MGEVTRCGLCGSDKLASVLDLGEQSLAEREDGKVYPLELVECQDCYLVQLGFIVPQHEVFPEDHPYTTGSTRANREHFAGLAQKVSVLIGPGDLAVDIGANDGTFLDSLACVAEDGLSLLGVEPTDQAKKCGEKGIACWQNYFTAEVGRGIRHLHGPVKVVTACNVLAHVPDPHDFMDGVTSMLADDGIFITENHDWASVVNGLQIDTIYHEHLRYYSIASLSRLLAGHGLIITGVESIPMHGGSFRVTAVRQQPKLSQRAKAAREELRKLMQWASNYGSVYGIGATTRATPLIHYTGIASFIDRVCEVPGSEKIGQTIPGTGIRIVEEDALIRDQPPFALLLSWHVADSIVPKLRAAGYKGQFIIPLPEPGIIDG